LTGKDLRPRRLNLSSDWTAAGQHHEDCPGG
jgi:hypothetical protein